MLGCPLHHEAHQWLQTWPWPLLRAGPAHWWVLGVAKFDLENSNFLFFIGEYWNLILLFYCFSSKVLPVLVSFLYHTVSDKGKLLLWNFLSRIKLVFFSGSGSTPLGTYKKLVEYYKAGKISFKYVKTFNMDEYVGKCWCGVMFLHIYRTFNKCKISEN